MRPVVAPSWTLSVAEARACQERLRDRVITVDRLGPVRTIAGVDVSYNVSSPVLYAAIVVLDAESLEPIEICGVEAPAPFPYIPGYLSFRELPPLSQAMASLKTRPDVIVCDGQGIAHPRRFGLACHLGVLYDIPTIGIAKSRFVGRHREPGKERGRWAVLYDDHSREVLGSVLRTRTGVKPLYVSSGHRVSLTTARRIALQLTPRWRQPETTRAAHNEVNRLRLEAMST